MTDDSFLFLSLPSPRFRCYALLYNNKSLYYYIYYIYIFLYIYHSCYSFLPFAPQKLLQTKQPLGNRNCHLSSVIIMRPLSHAAPSAPRLAVPTPQRGVSVPPCGACFFPCGGENFSCGGSFSLLCSSKTLKASPLRIRTCSPGLSKPGYEGSEHPRTYEFDKHIRCHQP